MKVQRSNIQWTQLLEYMSRSFLATPTITNFNVIKVTHKHTPIDTVCNIYEYHTTEWVVGLRSLFLSCLEVHAAWWVVIVPFIMACSKRMASSHTTKWHMLLQHEPLPVDSPLAHIYRYRYMDVERPLNYLRSSVFRPHHPETPKWGWCWDVVVANRR